MAAPQVYIDLDISDGHGSYPGNGFAYIYPTTQVTDPTDGVTITTSPVGVQFDGTLKSLQVYSTDNPNMSPDGWAWFLDFSKNPAVPGGPAPLVTFLPAGPLSFTATSASPCVFSWTTTADFTQAFNTGILPNGTALVLNSGAPTGFTAATTYYVINSAAGAFQLSATRGGSAINSSSTGSGTLTVTRYAYSGLVPQSNSAVYTPFLTPSGGRLTGALVTQVPNIVFDGDSLTYGEGTMPPGQFPAGQDYPSQVVSALDPRGSYYNIGVGGQQIQTMLANAAANVDTKLVAGRNNIVVICGGSNDIWVRDVNPYNDIVSYCQGRRAAGWKVVVGTIGPRTDAGLPGDFDTVRLACNASIRANWPTFADALADFGADPVIGDSADSADVRYYAGDLAHLNANGYLIRATIAGAALGTLGAIGSARKNLPVATPDVWVPANQMYVLSGSPAYGIMPGTIFPAYTLSHSATPILGCSFLPPAEWKQFSPAAVWARTGSASGNVAMALASWPQPVYTTLAADMVVKATFSSAYTWNANVVSTPKSAGTINSPLLINALINYATMTPRQTETILVKRDGTAGTDTCTDDVYLLGMYFRRQI